MNFYWLQETFSDKIKTKQGVGDDLSFACWITSLKVAAYVTSRDLTLVTWSKGYVWEPLTLN